MRNRKKYGKDWKKRARAAKEAADWRCSQCGVQHGTSRWSPWTERDYTVWLQAHHPNRDPENADAELIVVCARCHWRYFHKHDGPPPAWLIEAMKHRRLIVMAYLS